MRSLNLIDKAFLLKKTSLFGALDLDLLLSIADKMECVYFRPADTIFQLDQDAYRMYLIVSGQVLIADKSGAPLADLSFLATKLCLMKKDAPIVHPVKLKWSCSLYPERICSSLSKNAPLWLSPY
jgi:hypothetical protein